MRLKNFRFAFVEEKTKDLDKADPFSRAMAGYGLVLNDGQDPGEPAERAEEPVQADHVGALLCATRMRTGGDLHGISKTLKIGYGYLVAIEDGRHEDLPGRAYSIGFVRAYADYLGLDGNEVVRRLREEADGTVAKARFKFPISSTESGLPNGGLLAIAAAMGMLVYGGWYTMTNSGSDAVDLIQEVPGRLAVLIANDDVAQSLEIIKPTSVEIPGDQVELTSRVVSSEDTVSTELDLVAQDEVSKMDRVPYAGAPDVVANEEIAIETTDDLIAPDAVTPDVSPALGEP